MTPRTILYTGKGGVGKTSVAAATARRCAAAGLRTVVLSTDPAHSLGDVLEAALGPDPRRMSGCLWAQQVTAQEEMERHWAAVQQWLGDMLLERGVNRISAEELTVPPGMDELFSLLALKAHHQQGDWDVIVVDCAPTGETLRLLSFPEAARWWLDKVFPQQHRLLDAARPLARALLDVQLPGEAVLAEINRLVANLIAMHEILRDMRRVSVRLVMNPDRVVIDEARRTFTYLNLYGYLTDAVVVNRVFPEGVGAYFQTWRERQQRHLREVEEAFAPVPVLSAPYFEAEVRGPAMLDRLGDAVFPGTAAHHVLHDRLSERLEVGEREASLHLDLPFARRGDVTLKKVGLELIVRVAGHKRTMLLPPGLAGFRPVDAALEGGGLTIRFDAEEPAAEGTAHV